MGREMRRLLLVAPKMPPVTGERICAVNLAQRLCQLGRPVKWFRNNSFWHDPKADVWLFLGASPIGFWRDVVRLFIIVCLGQRCIVSVHNASWRRLIEFSWLSCLLHKTTFLVLSQRYAREMRSSGFTVVQFDNFVQEVAPVGVPKRCSSRLIWLSSVNQAKGFLTAYSIFERLALYLSSCRFDVFGPVDPSLNTLDFPAATFHGAVGNNEVARCFDHGGVLLLPSEYVNENQPLVMLEAFSAGIPVLVSAVGGLPEMVDSSAGPCGISVSSGRIEDYVAGIEEIISNYENYSKAARRKFEECYSVESFDRRLKEVLESTFDVIE